jgi:hypothetical protein
MSDKAETSIAQSGIDVAARIKDLEFGALTYVRKNAAKDLGSLAFSSEEVVLALMIAQETEWESEVKKVVEEALLAPAHQKLIQERPALTSKLDRSGYNPQHIDHAKRLLRKGLSPEEVKQALGAQGINPRLSKEYMDRAKNQISAINRAVQSHRDEAVKGLWAGLALLVAGIAVAVLSGGRYVAVAIPFGFVCFVLGLLGWLTYTRFPDLAFAVEENRNRLLLIIIPLAIAGGVIAYIFLFLLR